MQPSLVDELSTWTALQLSMRGEVFSGWRALSGDAGFRCYFRLEKLPYLAVYAPPATENSLLFSNIARFLRQQGLAVPEIIGADFAKGFLLISDLGTELYAAHLTDDHVDGLYGEAINTLLQLQITQPTADLLAAYDAATLRREMELFPQWFIGELLQYPLNADEHQLLAQTFSYLEQSAAKQPQVVVHRDFHSRNLILRQTQQARLLPPGLIDFQDALIGPAAYDLVSLLKDCYVDWPRSQVRSWALAYYQQAQQQGIWPRLREGEFIQSFDLIGLQRHLKVLGIFARLSLRDNKHGFLNDLPRVLAYTLDVLRQYPALAGVHQWFYQRLMPRIEQQAWYYPLKLSQ
ncbi:MAG TPA: phosphotransferase [Cellvibrionaceae bacterium]